MMKLYKNEAGFTLVEIMIVVLIIGIIAALVIPNLMSAQQTAWQKTCDGNRSTILAAAELYRIQSGSAPGGLDALTAGFGDYDAVLSESPDCPGDGEYSLQTENNIIKVYCTKHAPDASSGEDNEE